MTMSGSRRFLAQALSLLLFSGSAGLAAEPLPATAVSYRTATVDGLSIAYREAGPAGAPTLLLLHGFPSSSRMFEPLLARLAAHYHMVAPDYPGFGHSDVPDRKSFPYSFDHLAEVMAHFTDQLGLAHYVLYMQDYGGPVGFRLALAHPDRVAGLIVQNAVAHEDGLGPSWAPRRAFWADRAAHEAAFRQSFLSFETTRKRHIGSSPNPAAYDPDLWTDEFAFLSQPGETEIQSDLFFDWQTNVAAFPAWQAWLRQAHPPLLVVWGRYDPSFDSAEAQAYKRDVPDAEIDLIDGGHFAMDERPDQVASLIRHFLETKLGHR
jgi:pimeloyl-ACP methyl ester carboxylesterase